ncbi:helix-turn-helix domain-containing protein [Streptomyces rugosispiralis]|uniref:Helix-turn-helix domain-containing protein n=1 Tax=Streptomyces rugosispiralis TaxID=2967341 RepID=A0ABT1V8W3_9ACTN|nr:helix-turn-helix domain-containing protein [Streptomyces rugosispiralis]MCQ8193229.1 helix-turn-helix domain-containing protein [Streptomyces rugosispiralis]
MAELTEAEPGAGPGTTRSPAPGIRLVGRQAEVARVLDIVEEGWTAPRTLLLLGDAGTGKSGLLAAAVDHARDRGTLVLAAQGIVAESPQSFASLHQLLLPVMSDAAALPDHLRKALETAFGIALDEGPPDSMLLRTAVLALLSEVSNRRRVLLALDDVQHFDRDSLDVCGFVMRRITAQDVSVLLTARGHTAPAGVPADLPTVLLGPLPEQAAAELLDSQPYAPTGRTKSSMSTAEPVLDRMTTPSGCIQIVPAVPDERNEEFLYLGMIGRRSAAITGEGDEVFLEPGDLVFCDPSRRHALRFGDDCRLTVFRMPRCYLGVSEADLDRVVGVTVPGGRGLGALVSDLLSAFAAVAEFRTSMIGDRLARSAMDLVAVLVMELLETEAAAEASGVPKAGNEMLTRIRAYIEEHLMEPDLLPESIARAHRISVRYLHKLFQNDGTTVSHWVRQRRLDACRHELSRTPNRRITVAAVAHRWGFSSPAHFSRTFRDAYGMSPSEWQALAASDVGAR